MYRVGQYIVYGGEGVCRVECVGPVDIRGARKGQEYYTLSSVYHQGKVYLPVDAEGYSRPILTAQEADGLVQEIPDIPAEIFECSNPRLLTEHYQGWLKSNNCRDLLRVIRSIRAKGANAARKGRRLGQVDERVLKQAEEKLYGELAVSLNSCVEEVKARVMEQLAKAGE